MVTYLDLFQGGQLERALPSAGAAAAPWSPAAPRARLQWRLCGRQPAAHPPRCQRRRAARRAARRHGAQR